MCRVSLPVKMKAQDFSVARGFGEKEVFDWTSLRATDQQASLGRRRSAAAWSPSITYAD